MTDPGGGKPLIGRRILARVVDLLVAWALALFKPPFGIILGLGYLSVADGVQRGQSLGKMVFGLVVRRGDGGFCDVRSSVSRNLPFILVFLFAALGLPGMILLVLAGLPLLLVELWLIVVDENGERLGDRLAETRVTEALR